MPTSPSSDGPLVIEAAGGEVRARFPAEVDMRNSARIGDQLIRLLDDGVRTLILDLGGTRLCDASGVNVLMRVEACASERGVSLVAVVPAAGHPRKILDMCRLPEVIPTVTTLDAARARSRRSGDR